MNSRPTPIRVLQLGLGPIGVSSAELVLHRDDLKLVGAVDHDPQKAGRTVGELIGSGSCEVKIGADLAAALGESRPDVVLQTTGSRLPQVADQLKCCIRGGASVVSTCEELLYPWYRHGDLQGILSRWSASDSRVSPVRARRGRAMAGCDVRR